MSATIKISVKGTDYEVSIDEHSGKFGTRAGEAYVSADTLAGLKKKLSSMTVKVAIPYTRFAEAPYNNRPPEIADGEFTGVHANGRNVLAREGTRALQFYGGSADGLLTRLSEAERAELLRLDVAKRDANAALREYVDARRLGNPMALVTAAIEAKRKGGDPDGTDPQDS